MLYLSALTGTAYVLDTQLYASSLTRSLRTFGTGLLAAADYKMNFRPVPWIGESIHDLQRRNAERLVWLLRENGGLYLKIGQAIAMQSAVLPPEFQKMFASMFDDAPQNDWADVEKVIREDFGKSVEEVFGVSFTGEEGKGVMERTARASASVAQVHWARLADGREVAIKVQKREIAQQAKWDLWAFKVVMRVYTYTFDIPLYNLVPYITERLLLECDFENEANNSTKMASLVAAEPRLAGKVYIPKVYRDLTSKRIMTAEWIEGVRLWDKETLTAPWYGGRGTASPGCHGTPLSKPDPNVVRQQLAASRNNQNPDLKERLKPERNEWRGRTGKGGLGVSLGHAMNTMISLFSAQMFKFGLVHCDPHPGNIFIRRLPSGKPELVLIDHGLYITMTPELRYQYCLFWKSLLTFDNAKLKEITEQWGINQPDLFASATLMKPYTGGDGSTAKRITDDLQGKTAAERIYEVQQRTRQGMRDILADDAKFPRELLFIGRNMRIVQGNNQFLGSPVNRIKLTGMWASRSLVEDPDRKIGWRKGGWNGVKLWASEEAGYALFRLVMLGSDFVWWVGRFRQLVGWGRGMDDDLERNMRRVARDMGIELQHDVFEG